MSPASPAPSPLAEPLPSAEVELRYAAYRRRQAARLLDLLPGDAVRPLYRRAATAALRRGQPVADADPLALLLAYCEELLPLPPRSVWLRDLTLHPDGHLADLAQAPTAPGPDAPVTLATRTLTARGESWRVLLRAFRDDEAWRGSMVFARGSGGPSYGTAVIFRERDPLALRTRFDSFDRASLEAFFRSALP